MNKKQKWVIIAGLSLLFLACLFPVNSNRYGELWLAFLGYGRHVDTQTMLFECAGIAILTAIGFLVFRDDN